MPDGKNAVNKPKLVLASSFSRWVTLGSVVKASKWLFHHPQKQFNARCFGTIRDIFRISELESSIQIDYLLS